MKSTNTNNPAPSQMEVNRMLRLGILFSIFWLAGIGSVIGLVNGYRARRMIRESGGTLRGLNRVQLCVMLGWLGVVFWGFILVMIIVNNR